MNEQWPSMLSPTVTKQLKCKYITTKSLLGDGNFSIVKQCMNIHTKDFYAMKLIHKKLIKDKLQLIKREFNLLNNISLQIRDIEENENCKGNQNNNNTFIGHHHILQLFDFFETVDHIVLITQLCESNDLYDKIISNQHLDLTKQVIPYTACIISSLLFLHEQGIVHRDIKAENILFRLKKKQTTDSKNDETGNENVNSYDLTAHDVILADFGLAIDIKNSSKSSLKEYVGTISYLAPEIVSCKGISGMSLDQLDKVEPYDTMIDIWALGVLVYFMALGYTPFDCETDDETLDCISKCDYYIDNECVLDPVYKDFWNFIQCCFVIDSKKRKSAKDLTLHPFIKDYFNLPLHANSGDIINDNTLVDMNEPVMSPNLVRKNKSFTTLASLRRPPSRKSSQSFLTKISSNSSVNNMLQSYSSNNMLQTPLTTAVPSPITKPTSRTDHGTYHSSNNNIHYNSINNNNNANTNLIPPPIQSANIRDSLRRTLSMTSIKPMISSTTATANTSTNSFQSFGSSNYRINKLTSSNGTNTSTTNTNINSSSSNNSSSINNMIINTNTNSTFFLDPQPPKNSLMNGGFSETPESRSNFNTTPHSSLSRNSSIGNGQTISRVSSVGNHINNALNSALSNGAANGQSFSRNSSFKNLKMTYFDLDYESDSSLL